MLNALKPPPPSADGFEPTGPALLLKPAPMPLLLICGGLLFPELRLLTPGLPLLEAPYAP